MSRVFDPRLPIKVCITSIEYPPDVGGVGESVQRISKLLASAGYEIHVLIFTPGRRALASLPSMHDQSMSTTRVANRITIHRFNASRFSKNLNVQDYLAEVYSCLFHLHGQIGFDLFHSFFLGESSFATTLLAAEVRRPVVVSIRGSDLHRNVFNPLVLSHTIWSLSSASLITSVSRSLANRANLLVPGASNKTVCFWNSIESVSPFPSDPPSLVLGDSLVVGTVGNLRSGKGIHKLIWACVSVCEQADVKVLLVGDFVENQRDAWDVIVNESGLGQRLVITGKVKRLEALSYYSLIDIFVLPSLRDGCPNTLLEAMQFGKPIIASNVDAIGEILCHQENALLVSPGDEQQLAEAIMTLVLDSELRQRLGVAASLAAKTIFDPEREKADWLNVYSHALSM